MFLQKPSGGFHVGGQVQREGKLTPSDLLVSEGTSFGKALNAAGFSKEAPPPLWGAGGGGKST